MMVLGGIGVLAPVEPADAFGQHQDGVERSGRNQLRRALAGDPLEPDQQCELSIRPRRQVECMPDEAPQQSGRARFVSCCRRHKADWSASIGSQGNARHA